MIGEIIELEYHPEDSTGERQMKVFKTLRLRKVCYQDKKNRYYEFLSINFEIAAEEIAFLYKKRWGLDILFKKMKQNFQLHCFFSENENAIRTQVWWTLIAQLLLTVIQKIAQRKKAQTKKAFSMVVSLVRIHLISILDVNELLRSTNRDYQMVMGSSDASLQLALFGAKTGEVYLKNKRLMPVLWAIQKKNYLK